MINPGFLLLLALGMLPNCVVCQIEYQTCRQPFSCGSLRDIEYPFYGGNRPLSCGYPGFELDCEGEGAPFFNTSSIIYRLLDMDYPTQTLTVARNDLWNSLCTPLLVNTTLNITIYNFYWLAKDEDINLAYGCTVHQLSIGGFTNQFSCTVNGTNSWGLILTGKAHLPAGVVCRTAFSVPVSQISAVNLANSTTASELQTSLRRGFSIQWSAGDEACNNCARSGGSCGFNQTSASFACHCPHGSNQFTCPYTLIHQHGSRLDLQKIVIIGVSVCVPVLVILSIIVYYIRKRRRLHHLNQENNKNVEKFILNHGSLAPKRFSYNEIKKMTESFKDKLGQGGFGIVYKGELPDGQLVAVKVLTEIHDNVEEFINEVASISRTSHVNIVNLLGFCYERKKRALVYEFMPNKSLDKFIYRRESTDSECSLELGKLFEIALGVARGLEYLHRGCNTRIVHFDIKPQNILLDEDLCPKISDFGLAKLFKKKQSIVSMFGTRGTIGYIAPEVFSRNFGAVSHKSDVYSYGMMILEMVEAKEMAEIEPTQSSENYFPDNIYEHVLLKIKSLDDVVTDDKEEIEIKMLMVGLWCIQTASSDRPSMSKVVEMLEGSLQSIRIPPKPFLSSLEPLHISSSLNLDIEIST